MDSHHFAAHLRGCFGTVIDWTVIIGVDDVPLRLADLLAGFSIVVDLGYGLPMETAMRSCVLGTALARRLGLPDRKVAEVFYVSLLLHVGCLAYSHETNAWFGDDAALRRAVVRSNSFSETAKILIPEGTRDLPPTARLKKAALLAATGPRFSNRRDLASCETARAVARRIGLPSAISDALLDVHEWWNGRGARQLKGETIAASARIARVATDAVFLAALREPDAVAITIRASAGKRLDTLEGQQPDAGSVGSLRSTPLARWTDTSRRRPQESPRVLRPSIDTLFTRYRSVASSACFDKNR